MSGDRIKDFKNKGKDTDELRRLRAHETVELRKARKEDLLSKRRNIETDQIDHDDDIEVTIPNENELKQIISDLTSDDTERQYLAVKRTRKIICLDEGVSIDSLPKGPRPIVILVKAGILPPCIQLLNKKTTPEIQLEAAWILTNIASGPSVETHQVVQCGAIEPLIQLLGSPSLDVAGQAAWALGNIAGDGPALRDILISKGILPRLIALAVEESDHSLLNNVAWTLSNLCRTKKQVPPPEGTGEQCLPALAKLIQIPNIEIISSVCWAFSYLTQSKEIVEEMVNLEVTSRLVSILDWDNFDVVTPALQAVVDIAAGTEKQTQALISAGVLPILVKLLESSDRNILKDAAWTAANIAGGTEDQIREVVDEEIVPLLIQILNSGDFQSQKEAAFAIKNIASAGHIKHLYQEGTIPAMCDLLDCEDSNTIVVLLKGLLNMLMAAEEASEEDLEKVVCAIEECGGMDKIEELQSHDNETIHSRAYDLIDAFFSQRDEEEDDAGESLLSEETNSLADDFEMSDISEGGFDL